jgi:hypothetical protein
MTAVQRLAAVWLVASSLAACGGKRVEEDDGRCHCTPGNISEAKRLDGTPLDGGALLAQLRRHRADVEQHLSGRDVKLVDDEIRLGAVSLCQPCGTWVTDRMTVDQMFPMAKLDEAVDAVCLGLVLRNGSTAYGEARPKTCR